MPPRDVWLRTNVWTELVSDKLEAQVNRPKNRFLLCFFPKREPLTATDEEKARKYALAYLSKHQIQIPSKNAPSSDPIRIKYDRAFQLAFSEEFERSFTPIDYLFAFV